MGKDVLILCAVGDIVAFHKNPESAFEYVGPVLQEADIAFAQNERHYIEKGDTTPPDGFTELVPPKNAEALKLGGFDVISFASNHCMDLGPDVMLETVGVLRKLGFAVIGVGKNIEEARKPVIIERKGAKVAFLARASVLRHGYTAERDKPGCAPMRAWTHYHQEDYQPGTPPQILTFPYKEDLEFLVEDVKKAKAQADIVAVSLHWGVHFVHAVIAMYQKEVAHTIIDAGADIILGTHPHVLKGIEVYKGKPIFYSMGNFAFDFPQTLIKANPKVTDFLIAKMKGWGFDLDDPEFEICAFPLESRKSMIVRCYIRDKKIERACFLPVLINQKAQPQVLLQEDKNFDELFRYITEITASEGLKTKYSVEGNEIVVPLI